MIDVEDRITDRMSRARLRVEVKRSRRPLIWLAVGLTGAFLGWLFLVSNISKSVYTSHHAVSFMVSDATGVVAGRAEVRIKGIPAGTITKSKIVDGHAVLTAEIYDKYGKIFRDARAALRPNTPLQDVYLNIIDRGHPAAGEAVAGRPLSLGQTSSSVNVADVLQAFDPETRSSMRQLLANLGGGLEDRGAKLRQVFLEVTPFVRAASAVTDQLRVRGARTKRLVHNFSLLTNELGDRDTQLRRLTHDGGATLQELSDHPGGLNATLQELAPTLERLDTSFAAFRRVLGDTDSAVTSLRPVAGRLPTALAALRRLAAHANPAVDDLQTPVRKLEPLAAALRPAAVSLSDALDGLVPQLPAIDHVVKSTSGCTLGIYQFFQNTASVVKMGDARGAYPRGDAVVSIGSGGGVRDPNQVPVGGCAPGHVKTNQP